MFRQILTVGFLSSATMLAAAHAHAVTYDYVGSPYNVGVGNGGVFTTVQDTSVYGADLTASVTFDSKVTANYTGNTIVSDITAWSVTSGMYSANSASGTLNAGNFTFADGAITGWIFSANPSDPAIVFTSAGAFPYTDYFVILNSALSFPLVGNQSNLLPGPWTKVSSVPLPAALPLFGAAFAGLAGLCMRKSRGNKAALTL